MSDACRNASPFVSYPDRTVRFRSSRGRALAKAIKSAPSPHAGSKTSIGFLAEMRNKVSDPDDLATMWKTDLANLFKLPVAGEVRINHQLNTVNAKTYHLVDLDQYVQGHSVSAEPDFSSSRALSAERRSFSS